MSARNIEARSDRIERVRIQAAALHLWTLSGDRLDPNACGVIAEGMLRAADEAASREEAAEL